MNTLMNARKLLYLLLVSVLMAFLLSACSGTSTQTQTTSPEESEEKEIDTSRFLVAVEDEPDTVDFQCTTIHYTIALNVFNCLVEMKSGHHGEVLLNPALAESWEVSDDRRTYTFHLREGVRFSNGSPLTSSDVLYTFTRLLTHPDSCNKDIADQIEGASALMKGETDTLKGIRILDDRTFTITLEQPFGAFLPCIAMPAASILDQETTEAAGDAFGKDPEATMGTGSFILEKWVPGEGMLLRANPDCWEGVPDIEGLDLRFLTDSETEIEMFENGEIDILDLDELGDSAEYFIHGDIYKDRLYQVHPVGITYFAFNESKKPFDDVRVRKALQLGLDRVALLDAVYSGRGRVENGIYPEGLTGFNPELPAIPYDQDAARKLLAEAGYPDGLDLTVYVKASATQWELSLMKSIISKWEEINVHADLDVISEKDFMDLRTTGELPCYVATWTADYNDPDNFIYTFFGSPSNTTFRSLCYPDTKVMDRVSKARGITDDQARLKEYRALEKLIIQDDAAWIPLFSRMRYYVVSKRLENFQSAWNGSVKNVYRYMKISDDK